MAWLHNTKGGRAWFGKAEAKANGKRARRQEDRERIDEALDSGHAIAPESSPGSGSQEPAR